MNTTITEEYGQDGNVWISIKIEINGMPVQFIDFASHEQVAQLTRRLQEYLNRRRIFNADISDPEAAEPLADEYGKPGV